MYWEFRLGPKPCTVLGRGFRGCTRSPGGSPGMYVVLRGLQYRSQHVNVLQLLLSDTHRVQDGQSEFINRDMKKPSLI